MHIRHLSGGSYETLERAIFLNQLPALVRTALANSTAASNEALAKEAGTFMREYKLSTSRSSAPHISASEVPLQVAASMVPSSYRPQAVSYTHLTLPTIYPV